jgi:hypothetical protein
MQHRSNRLSSPQSDKEQDDADDLCLDPYFDDLAATHTPSNESLDIQLVSSSSGDGQASRRRRRRQPDDPEGRRSHHRSQSPSSSSLSSSSGSPTAMQRVGTPDPESLAHVRGQDSRGKALRSNTKGGTSQRKRIHSSSTKSRYAVALVDKERAARTLMLTLLVASLVTVMFLAFYVPSPDPMIDEESRVMWNLGGRPGVDRSDSLVKAAQRRDSVCVVLPATRSAGASVGAAAPGNESISDSDDLEPDYGGLDFELFEEAGVSRAIYHDPSLDETKKDREPEQEERVDMYYAFDDDERRNPYNSRKSKKGQRCRRTKFHRRRPINCNSMYEMDFWNIVATGNQKYLGGGSYRDVHIIDIEGNGKFVYKTSGPDANFRYDDYEFIRMDCVVLELLSSSPSIVNSYAYCGLDQVGEAMLNGDFESLAWPIGGRKSITLNDADHVDPQNSLTPDDKLRFALEMAEALAELHGFYGGVLVHDDIQLSVRALDRTISSAITRERRSHLSRFLISAIPSNGRRETRSFERLQSCRIHALERGETRVLQVPEQSWTRGCTYRSKE